MLRINELTNSMDKHVLLTMSALRYLQVHCILLGPNGAGKSTVIKSIAGLLRYSGKVEISGHENKSVEAKRYLGYVAEFPAMYELLTVREHLEFIAGVQAQGLGG